MAFRYHCFQPSRINFISIYNYIYSQLFHLSGRLTLKLGFCTKPNIAELNKLVLKFVLCHFSKNSFSWSIICNLLLLTSTAEESTQNCWRRPALGKILRCAKKGALLSPVCKVAHGSFCPRTCFISQLCCQNFCCQNWPWYVEFSPNSCNVSILKYWRSCVLFHQCSAVAVKSTMRLRHTHLISAWYRFRTKGGGRVEIRLGKDSTASGYVAPLMS